MHSVSMTTSPANRPPPQDRLLGLAHGALWTVRHRRRSYGMPVPDALRERVQPGSAVVDVGAHAGSWTLPLSEMVGADGAVIAYEGLPRYATGLRVVVRLARAHNVAVRDVVLGAEDGAVDMVYQDEAGDRLTGMTHVASEDEPGRRRRVQMRTLDGDLASIGVGPRVALLKVDVEGLELPVLRGASRLLANDKPTVFLEADPRWTVRYGYEVGDLFTHLMDAGYQASIIEGSAIKPVTINDYLAQTVVRDVLFSPVDA